MRRFSFACCCAALLVLGLCIPAYAQRPSPPAKAHCSLSNGKTIDMAYSSPRMKGRKIYGGLVPFGEVWRAGANEATTFETNAGLSVGGKPLPAGSYTIFVVPNPDKWTFIVSKKTGEWGIPYPGEQYDLFRTDMNVGKLSPPMEDFTIGFEKTGKGCALHMDWETTRASIEISPSS